MTLSRRQALATLLGGTVPAPAQTPRSMIVRSARPEDFEMPLDGFATYITPVERFYVRSHHYTPQVDPRQYRLTIGGQVERPLTLAIDELLRRTRTELVSVMECAGNGRGLLEPPIRGVQWLYGAVGNARWAGVRLADVLREAGPRASAQHVAFDGADVPVGRQPDFQRSIPIARAMHPDTLLAWEMNGAPLTPSHGFPLRLIIPGWAGDGWVKWVTSLRLIESELDSFYMKSAYRHPGRPAPPGKRVDPAHMHPVTSLAVKSIIATPADEAKIASGPVRIAGAAWSGETPVRSVEVSTDRGRSWQRAAFSAEQHRYGWRLWSYDWTPAAAAHYVIMARAWDAGGRTQPLVQEWNPQGYLNNVVQQVAIEYGSAPERAEPAKVVSGTPAAGKFEPPRGYSSACLSCHGEDIISEQRLSREQWDEEVGRMIAWGAPVNPPDRGLIVEYLLRLYGPRPLK